MRFYNQGNPVVDNTMRATNSQISETISNITKQSKFGTVLYTKLYSSNIRLEVQSSLDIRDTTGLDRLIHIYRVILLINCCWELSPFC